MNKIRLVELQLSRLPSGYYLVTHDQILSNEKYKNPQKPTPGLDQIPYRASYTLTFLFASLMLLNHGIALRFARPRRCLCPSSAGRTGSSGIRRSGSHHGLHLEQAV